jgi:hypothetical protein
MVLVMIAVPGCPEANKQQLSQNYVKGKVTMQNKPVMGVLTFTATDGKKGTVTVYGDGNYTIENPPQGKCTITMTAIPGAAPPAAGSGDTKDMSDKMAKMMNQGKTQEYVFPPAKYASPDNGLKPYEVKPGRQEYDIQLQP